MHISKVSVHNGGFLTVQNKPKDKQTGEEIKLKKNPLNKASQSIYNWVQLFF